MNMTASPMPELRTDAEWHELSAGLIAQGFPTKHDPSPRWRVTVWRPGEGAMTFGRGRTMRRAFLIACFIGKGTVFAKGLETFDVWDDLFGRAACRFRANRNCTRASAEKHWGGIGVEITREPGKRT